MATTPPAVDPTQGDDLVLRISEAVAESAGTDPLSLPPLERTIDSEALVAIVNSDALSHLTFSYHDHLVTVDSHGHVWVSPDRS